MRIFRSSFFILALTDLYMTYYALIVAGGSGSRMNSKIPKQFLLLNGKPVIMHTVEAFYRSAYHPNIILVLNPETFDQWNELCRQYHFEIPVITVAGGANRFDSVKNGLMQVTGEGIVAIHDAVRPVVSEDLISRSFTTAEKSGNAVPAIRSKDSVRRGTEKSSQALNRDEIFLVQTPQTFKYEILRKAYEQPFEESFTDDASVVERSGEPIRLIEGDVRNIKITFPQDLLLAEYFLKQ